ncbi:MAG: hypothetical protein EHM72_15600 [Calditrichaeota bacterium]|nr:MAG: hypothetical protein EHM72_15600 [Calditrichota bacterium]
MKARIWPVSDPEPVEWQADARDTLATFRCGSVGVWSAGLGAHQFDDLLVRSEQGDTLLVEDFEATPIHQDPFGWVDFNYEQQAIPWMMRQIPDSAVSILLAHSPDVIRSSAAAGIDLQLSGHTHGGQLYLPFWGPVYNPLDIGRQYTRGLFRFEDTRLYVNRGIGVVLAPLRFCSRPEITIFDIH